MHLHVKCNVVLNMSEHAVTAVDIAFISSITLERLTALKSGIQYLVSLVVHCTFAVGSLHISSI